ncbi:MAG: YebC/PmpR family DNA-binding transcriptional regulator [Patescibacteria group bacterium]
MSGHSKWATTKRKKAAIDAKRAKIFTKIAHLITIAAKNGKSGDVNFNPSLRMAVDNARAISMPKENIEKAIKRGLGDGTSNNLEEISYEAYGPYGIGMIIEGLTDNRNRTVSEIKNVLNKYGGTLAGSGNVAYQFSKIGEISIDTSKNSVDEDTIESAILNSGADDYDEEEGFFVIRTKFSDLHQVKEKLESTGLVIDSSEAVLIPNNPVSLEKSEHEKIEELIEKIEEQEDITNVYITLA